MGTQHTENLFRRYKGELVNVKTISGGVYEGRVNEITNDFISLVERGANESAPVFVFFSAIESIVVIDLPSGA